MKTKNLFQLKTSTINLLVATALIFLAFVSAKAQSIKGGIVLGVTSSDIKIDRSFNNIMNGKNIYGFEGGFFLKPKLGPFYAKPELLYEYRYGRVTSLENSNVNFSMHNLEVPVLFGFCICPVFIEAGPVYNYVLGVTSSYGNNNVQLNKNGFGYRVGAGVDLGMIILHAHYQGITYQASSDNATFKDPSKLIFGVSLALGGSHHHNYDRYDRDRDDMRRTWE